MTSPTERYGIFGLIAEFWMFAPRFDVMHLQIFLGTASDAGVQIALKYFLAPLTIAVRSSELFSASADWFAFGEIAAFVTAKFRFMSLPLSKLLAAIFASEHRCIIANVGTFGRTNPTITMTVYECLSTNRTSFSSTLVANEMPRMGYSEGFVTSTAISDQCILHVSLLRARIIAQITEVRKIIERLAAMGLEARRIDG